MIKDQLEVAETNEEIVEQDRTNAQKTSLGRVRAINRFLQRRFTHTDHNSYVLTKKSEGI